MWIPKSLRIPARPLLEVMTVTQKLKPRIKGTNLALEMRDHQRVVDCH